MRWPLKHWLTAAYVLLMAALLAHGVQQWRQAAHAGHTLLETDLLALLPEAQQQSAAQKQAIARIQADVNRQIILLVGAPQAEAAVAASADIVRTWQNSGLLQQVDWQIAPDLAQLSQQLQPLAVAAAPPLLMQQLQQQPQAFFRQRAEAIANPFAANAVVPIEQDWLGLQTAILPKLQADSRVQWSADSHTLQIHDGQQTWVLVRGRLPEHSDGAALLALIERTQAQAKQAQAQTLLAGGAIYAALGQQSGQAESSRMSFWSIGLTVLLLGGVFRRLRLVWLALPVVCGLLAGVLACLLWFDHIHIMTLVIGTSLVGLVIDFPLHWLAQSLLQPGWQAWPALKAVRRAFGISLLVTVSGYVALLFTPLPILQQTAVFSGAALLSTFACTALCLPFAFQNWQPRPNRWLAAWMQKVCPDVLPARPPGRWWPQGLALALLLLLVAGLGRSHWQDDIRQWVHTPADWWQQAASIGRLTGIQPTSQFFMLEATSTDDLLAQEQQLSQRLQHLQQQGQLGSFTAISQWISPTTQQQDWKQGLAALAEQPQAWADLRAIGVPDQVVRTELRRLSRLPDVPVQAALASPLAERWQALWLGDTTAGKVASMVTLSGIGDTRLVAAAAQGLNGVQFIDHRADLNQLFERTRNEAIVLKLASYGFALTLLWFAFGRARAWRILTVPLFAAVATVAVFGWLGQTVTLFGMFGLLLVTAIGIDYAIYATMPQMPRSERGLGILLAALTTLISFGLLSSSATPAVAGFGLSVSIGVGFNLLAAWYLLRRPEPSAAVVDHGGHTLSGSLKHTPPGQE